MGRVIVGVDGSPFANHALAWAVERASAVDAEVVAVFVWNVFNQGFVEKGEALEPDFGDAEAAAALEAAVAEAGVAGAVESRVIRGAPAEAVTGLADDDDLIVVGARGLGGFKGLLLGSVSSQVLELAPCPVVVIHDAPPVGIGGEIVVGVDGSHGSGRALAWAADEARLTGAPLRLVAAWQAPLYPTMAVPQVLDALREGTEEQVRNIAAEPALEGLEVTTEVVAAGAAQALVDRDDAAMIVVGSRGHGSITGLILGSVSRQVVHHALVPVVVV